MDLDPHGDADPITGRTFRVSRVAGLEVLPAPTAVLTFDADGVVSGRATINRVRGSYQLTGGRLLCGPMASTMMAGPADEMDQEQRLLAVLGEPLTVRAGEDGAELVAPDGSVTTLREVAGDEVLL